MRLTLRCFAEVGSKMTKALDHYSRFHPSIMSIQRFIDFGNFGDGTKNASAKQSFLFLRKELPVRWANILKEMRLLPEQLLSQPSAQHVLTLMENSFLDVLEYEHLDPDEPSVLNKFNQLLDFTRNRHQNVVETMAEGVLEMKEYLSHEDYVSVDARIQYFLDRFYMSRIGLRMIIHQHLLLFSDDDNHPRHIGCIDPACDVLLVTEDAYDSARFLCENYYNTAPECDITCHFGYDKTSDADERILMTYVPSHLYHILFELLKNALRAVVEFNGESVNLPKVKILICKGREDVIIKITDQGGGIPRSEIHNLFNYMYSTAPRPPSPELIEYTPLAGYGYGLPLSRLYAKYFNGDLLLNSVDGYGTDAAVFLKVFPCDANELLPIYNKTSLLKYKTARQVGDWSDPKYVPTGRESGSSSLGIKH